MPKQYINKYKKVDNYNSDQGKSQNQGQSQ